MLLAALALPGGLPTPPVPTPSFDPDEVTPGPIGFAFIFLTFVVVALIAFDLIRRVRRVKHREQVRAKLQAELDAHEAQPDEAQPDGEQGRQPLGDESALDGESPLDGES